MATFLSNVNIGTWYGWPWTATLTGNVSRSGNRVTLSSLYCGTSSPSATGSDGSVDFRIQNSSGGQLTHHQGISMSGGSGGFWFDNVGVDVSASSTSYTFKFQVYDPGTGTYTYNFTVTFPSGAYTFKVTGTGVTFDVSLGGSSVASDTSSYTNSNVNPNTAWVVSDIKAVVGKYYTGLTTESGTVTGNTTKTYTATGDTYAVTFNSNGGVEFDLALDTGSTYNGAAITSAVFNNTVADDGAAVTAGSGKGIRNGTKWKILNITENSDNYYYAGEALLSGTISAASTITIPTIATTAPTGLTTSMVSRTWNSVTLSGAITDYGDPDDRAGRYVEVGIAPSNATGYGQRYATMSTADALTTGNKTITHANLVGCAAFKIGTYAHNTKKFAQVLQSTVYYLPPHDPVSVNIDSFTGAGGVYTAVCTGTGAAADGTSNVSGAQVIGEYRYSTDNGSTYSNWTEVSATAITPNTAQTFTITGIAQDSLIVQYRQKNASDTTQISGVVYDTENATIADHLYVSVNGQSKEVQKLYVSVNGQSKRVIKAYIGNANDRSRITFE